MIITLLIRALLLHGLRCRNEMSQHFNLADQSFFKNAWIKLQHYCMWGHLRHCCLSCALPWNKTSGGTEACRGSYFNPNMNSYLATRPAAAAVLLSSKAIGTRAFYLHKKKKRHACISINKKNAYFNHRCHNKLGFCEKTSKAWPGECKTIKVVLQSVGPELSNCSQETAIAP